MWPFYPLRNFFLHCTESYCILHYGEEVQAATTELKVKELGMKGKYLSGEITEGIHRKLLGCCNAPLPTTALSNHSTLRTHAGFLTDSFTQAIKLARKGNMGK